MLLGDRGTWVWTTCPRLLLDSTAAVAQTSDHWVISLMLQVNDAVMCIAFTQKHSLCMCMCSISGTVAVIVTCPLEVVKTRFQSSVYTSLMRTVSYTPHCAYSASAVPGTSYLAYEMHGKASSTLHSFLHKSPSGGFSRIWWFIGWVIVHYCCLGTSVDGICSWFETFNF